MFFKNEKKEIRNKILIQRKNYEKEYIKASNEEIYKKVISMKNYEKANNIFSYVSMEDEVDTRRIIETSFQLGKIVAVPRCIELGLMEAFIIKSFDDLEVGKMGILEPKEKCLKIDKKDIEFSIVPCVTCNEKGHRLGYGGGFYDRYLKDIFSEKILLCRKKSMVEYIPMDEYDLIIEKVISD